MRNCKRCRVSKSHADFYDGDNSCKPCRRAAIAEYRLANIEKIRAYDRGRGQIPSRQANNRRNYRKRISTPSGRASEWERARSYRDEEKRKARLIVQYALRSRRMTKDPCSKCGSEIRVHGHHENYARPLDVIWLCAMCHGERHREINEAKRQRMQAA